MTNSQGECVLVWLRLDLRLDDNPALTAAAAAGLPLVPVFIRDPDEEQPGGASDWWLHQSLLRMEESLRARGSRLIVRCGSSAETLLQLARETSAQRICSNRVYEPALLARDKNLQAELRTHGISLEQHNGSLLFEPGSLRTTAGGFFQVFTPFWRALWNSRGAIRSPWPAPSPLAAPHRWPHSLTVADLKLEPILRNQPDWAGGLREAWTPGEDSARRRLDAFAHAAVSRYDAERDRTDHDGTSRLSPHLHFGELSPVRLWETLIGLPGAEPYLRQLAWREFASHLLVEYPHTPTEPFNPAFRAFPWRRNQRRLKAWQRGRTGYPFVDAGMRQLWHTGWMHNRTRLVVASFLVKHLLIPWQDGAAWFLDTLVDADLANNTMGWQWVSGCGVDAAPYFRIFNPVLQGEKFDPEGAYVREWVPELASVPAQWIHKPWMAPPLLLSSAGVRLGDTYPYTLVDHAEARAAALAAFDNLKSRS